MTTATQRGQSAQSRGGTLRSGLRSGDFPAHIDGDEFAVLLPDTNFDAARKFIPRLVEALENKMIWSSGLSGALFGFEILSIIMFWDGRFQRNVNKFVLKFFQKVKQAGAVVKTHPSHGLSVKLRNSILQSVPESPTRFGQYYQSSPAVLGVRYPSDMPIPFHSFEDAIEALATDVKVLFQLME